MVDDPSSLQTGLIELLQDELATLNRLHALLEAEYQVLAGRESKELEVIVQSKQALIEALEGHAAKRERYLGQVGLANDHATITGLLAEDAAASQLFESYREILAQCRQRNLTHGGIIELSQNRIAQALDILRGTERSTTYGPSGRHASAGGGGRIGTA